MKEKMISASERHFRALGSLDDGKYVACFSEDTALGDGYWDAAAMVAKSS